MNVLHLNRFFSSGQTTHVFSLVREQQKQGINALLIMEGHPPYQAAAVYKKVMEELGAVIIRPQDSATLKRHIQKKRIHLIHAHSSLTYPVAYSLAKGMGVPYVITCHGLGLNKQEYRPFFQGAGAVVCISPRVADSLREFAHKIHIIPNGVDLDEFKPGPKEEPVKVAFVARIDQHKQKGYGQFCKAVDLLENVEFYVAANHKPPAQKAVYLGWTGGVADLLARTDIVAGTGRAVIEGMAAGNAAIVLGRAYQGIVTPEYTFMQQFIDVSGLLGSAPCYRDIFYDLTKLVENRVYLRQLQKFGRELAEKEFNNRVLTARLLRIYNKLF